MIYDYLSETKRQKKLDEIEQLEEKLGIDGVKPSDKGKFTGLHRYHRREIGE